LAGRTGFGVATGTAVLVGGFGLVGAAAGFVGWSAGAMLEGAPARPCADAGGLMTTRNEACGDEGGVAVGALVGVLVGVVSVGVGEGTSVGTLAAAPSAGSAPCWTATSAIVSAAACGGVAAAARPKKTPPAARLPAMVSSFVLAFLTRTPTTLGSPPELWVKTG
jgi:hypothetical protein